jgi:hypothetical protein
MLRVRGRKGVADGPDVMDPVAVHALGASRTARCQSLGVARWSYIERADPRAVEGRTCA